MRELSPAEAHLAYPPMVRLRLDLNSIEEFVAVINDRQRRDGYRLAASFDGRDAASVAGFRQGHSLAWGEFLYVDDLVTLEEFRGRGHASALLDWLIDEARRVGCSTIHLDSGSHRHDAHRFYLNHRYRIAGYHFVAEVEGGSATNTEFRTA